MRFITRAIWFALFILLLAFAAANTAPATLRFWFDYAWQAPLVLLLLAFFAAGALFGVAAALGTVMRQRREVLRLRRELRARAAAREVPAAPPPPAEG
jgi:lipopolysaccharide assembly protein A